MTLIVNFIGGPGVGKSTMAACAFSHLKKEGINAELVTEYAKDKVWEDYFSILEDQLYIFAKQNRRLHRLRDKVDVVLTDSPIFLSLVYERLYIKAVPWGGAFRDLVLAVFNSYENMTFLLERPATYSQIGRVQTLEEAIALDELVQHELESNNIPFQSIPTNEQLIVEAIKENLEYG